MGVKNETERLSTNHTLKTHTPVGVEEQDQGDRGKGQCSPAAPLQRVFRV